MTKDKWNALKAKRWRLYCPQLNLYAGVDRNGDIVPCETADDPRVQVFDGRDNEKMKLRYYTAVTGIAWTMQSCAS